MITPLRPLVKTQPYLFPTSFFLVFRYLCVLRVTCNLKNVSDKLRNVLQEIGLQANNVSDNAPNEQYQDDETLYWGVTKAKVFFGKMAKCCHLFLDFCNSVKISLDQPNDNHFLFLLFILAEIYNKNVRGVWLLQLLSRQLTSHCPLADKIIEFV